MFTISHWSYHLQLNFEGYVTSVKSSRSSVERDEGCTVNEAPYLFYKRIKLTLNKSFRKSKIR